MQSENTLYQTFSIVQSKNKNDKKGMQESIRSFVAHAFGDHTKCGNWCKFQDDPKNYHDQNLPGSHDLKGEGLRTFLEENDGYDYLLEVRP